MKSDLYFMWVMHQVKKQLDDKMVKDLLCHKSENKFYLQDTGDYVDR